MPTNYQRGSNFERQVKAKLEKKGYYVMRSAGSHTVVDLLAIKEDSILLIQLKSSSKQSVPDIKELFKPTCIVEKRHKVNGVWHKTKEEVKSNVKLLEEMYTPELYGGYPSEKIILWKGTDGLFQWEWDCMVNQWVMSKQTILKEL